MIENDIKTQVQKRIKSLLLDETVNNYKNYEVFLSSTNSSYRFLIWKLQPLNWENFCSEIENLITEQGYQCIDGAWDVSTYNKENKTGYKVIALYKN